MGFYSLEEGEELVRAARNAIELSIISQNLDKEIIEKKLNKFDQKHGVFVTIYHYPTRTLRGCIGFMEGIGPIKRLIVDAAIGAAAEDPRFVPISHLEFEHMIIEVSILSKTERIIGEPQEIKEQVKIGRDGLVIEYGYHKGLLLPIVAVDQRWYPEEFLENVCIKAGLPDHMWKQHDIFLYRFSTQVFREVEPRGKIEEVRLEEL
jgi:uncharacterized protein (TIGR00296 family)